MSAARAPGPSSDEDASTDVPPVTNRPVIERLGMVVIALFVATMFGVVAAASWAGGQGFLALMAGTGTIMTLWAGLNGLRRS